MKLIDADMLLENYEHIKEHLTQKYGEEEATRGLHFSLNDCISNIENQPEVKRNGCHCRNHIERRNDMTTIAIFLAGAFLGSLITMIILALIGINDRDD